MKAPSETGNSDQGRAESCAQADAAIIAFLADRDCRCPGPCGANLRSVKDPNCPRCGRLLRLLIDPTAKPPPANAAELVLVDDVPCPGCGYNLRGLASLKCPECGRVATDRDFFALEGEWCSLPETQRRNRMRSIRVGSAISAVLLGFVTITLAMWALDPRVPYFISIANDPIYFMMLGFGVFWGDVFASTFLRVERWSRHGLTFLLFLGIASWIVPLLALIGICAGLLGR